MRFLHTSDLQIGKVFGNFSTEESSALQDARQASIRALGQAAIEAQASAVLIAGDIYEKQQMSQQALARAVENMRPFTNLKWHLMPGNHDRYQENGLWDRLAYPARGSPNS
jgi:DNA repair exonuclease SbcCD nuclease subunit